MKQYTDELWCEFCDKYTNQEVSESGHERDSSNDSFKCTTCNRTKRGMSGDWEDMSEEKITKAGLEWIDTAILPQLVLHTSKYYSTSKRVVVLFDDGGIAIAECVDEGDTWYWYCRVREEALEGVIAWCDCIPDIPKQKERDETT